MIEIDNLIEEQIPYFADVKKGDKVFGLVFGEGTVCTVWEEDSYYTFEVYFENGYTVPYTDEGIPGWNITFNFQTIFYVHDISIEKYDFRPALNDLGPKDIITLRLAGKLEVRCPSGFWRPSDKCPDFIVTEYYENKSFHLFRRSK